MMMMVLAKKGDHFRPSLSYSPYALGAVTVHRHLSVRTFRSPSVVVVNESPRLKFARYNIHVSQLIWGITTDGGGAWVH